VTFTLQHLYQFAQVPNNLVGTLTNTTSVLKNGISVGSPTTVLTSTSFINSIGCPLTLTEYLDSYNSTYTPITISNTTGTMDIVTMTSNDVINGTSIKQDCSSFASMLTDSFKVVQGTASIDGCKCCSVNVPIEG
jgi:hypothetical protein